MDDRLELWDLATGEQKKSYSEAFNDFWPDGKGFFSWDQDSLRFCSADTGKQFAFSSVSPATYAPRSGGLGGPVPIPGTCLLAVPSGTDENQGFFYQWCSRLLGIKKRAQQELDSQVVFLDTRSGQRVAAIEVPNINGAISPDGKTLALSMLKNDESLIEIWDIPPRKPLRWVLGLLTIRVLSRYLRSGHGGKHACEAYIYEPLVRLADMMVEWV
jgi:hypothetical protein